MKHVGIRARTSETQERIDRLKRAVENRCPVMDLFRSADVDRQVTWERVAP